jgi:hypothetical protein
LIRIISDLGAHIDPSNTATACQDHEESDEDKSLIAIHLSPYGSRNISPFHCHRER